MKVILLAEVRGKGGEGDVVDVAPGFANNYLFTHKLAIKATKGNLKQLEQRKHNIATREEKRLAKANETKAVLDAATIKVVARVGEEGVLFGSVTAQQIVDAVKEQAEVEIDRRRIDIKQPIKTAGEHKVSVALYRDIKAELTLVVGDEATLNASEEEAPAEEAAPSDAETEESAAEAQEAAPAEPAEEATAE